MTVTKQGGYTDRRILIYIGSIIIKHTIIRNDEILRYLRYKSLLMAKSSILSEREPQVWYVGRNSYCKITTLRLR